MGTSIPNLTVDVVPPMNPNDNDLWWDSSSGFLSIFFNDGNSRQWVVTPPGKGGTQGPPGLPGAPAGNGVAISDLPVATQANLTDQFEANQGGASRSVTLTQINSALLTADAYVVSTIFALQMLPVRPGVVITQGWANPGDGGGGPRWLWVPNSTAIPDNFMTVAPSGVGPNGRWIRDIERGASVSPKWGGAGLDPSGNTNDTPNFQVVLHAGGAHAVDVSGCTLFLTGASVFATDTCPGIYSDGSGTFKCFNPGNTGGTSTGTFLVSIYKSDFYVDRVQFVAPISHIPGVSPACSNLLSFEGPTPGQETDRQRVTNCQFIGSNSQVQFRNTNNNGFVWFTDNYLTDSWGQATSFLDPKNCFYARNTVVNCGWDPTATAGGIHFGYTGSAAMCEDLIVTDNVIRDCCQGFAQEAIDLYGDTMRNAIFANNVLDHCTHGGFELKTSSATPNYGDILIIGNTVNFLPGGSGIGVALNCIGPNVPDHSLRRIKISGNEFLSDDTTTTNTNWGVTVDGWDTVEITDNMFNNIYGGVWATATGSPTQTLFNLAILGNRFNTSNSCITTSRNIQNLTIKNNVCKGGYHPLSLTANTTGLVCDDNYIEATGGDYAIYFMNVHAGANGVASTIANNVVRSTYHAPMYWDAPASDNTRIVDNDIVGVYGFGINVAQPASCLIANNTIEAASGAMFFGAGTASCTRYNNRGLPSQAMPTIAGTVGDIMPVPTPVAGGYIGWVCTAPGAAGAAVWKGYGGIAT